MVVLPVWGFKAHAQTQKQSRREMLFKITHTETLTIGVK